MAQARTRDAHTDLPTAAVGVPAAPATQPSQITLSTGKVVTLRLLSGLDSSTLEQVMAGAGFSNIAGVGQSTYFRCAAIYSIADEDGRPVMPPQSPAELKARLAGLLEPDCAMLAHAFLRLNGMLPPTEGEQGATFRD